MRGNPKYKVGDIVQFEYDINLTTIGMIGIVDKYGTFFEPEDVSYDIWAIEPKYKQLIFYKHCQEKLVVKKLHFLRALFWKFYFNIKLQ